MQRPLRVLVVDDNHDIVLSTVVLVREAGHQCAACYSGEDALQYVRGFDPDVVLMDIRMPGLSGWDAAQAIRREHPDQRPMLVGISGEHTRSADKIRAETVGFDYYLLKPADPNVLLKILEKAAHAL